MGRNRINFQSELVFAGPAPATGFHFISGSTKTNDTSQENLVKQLHRIQSVSYDFNVNRQNVYQFGELAEIDNVIVNTPSVNLGMSYYLANFENEKNIGLSVNSDKHCLFNLISGGDEERNYFIKIVAEGLDAINSTGETGANVDVVGIGNAVLTSYSNTASIDSFPMVDVSFEGFNMVFEKNSINNPIPAISKNGGVRLDSVYYSLPIPTGSAGTGDLGYSVVRPRDIILTVNQVDTGVIGPYSAPGPIINQGCIQGYTFSFDINREPLERLGVRYAKSRKILGPIDYNLSIDLIVNKITTGSLTDIVGCGQVYNADLVLYKPEPCESGLLNREPLVQYNLKHIHLDSIIINSSIGSNKSATINFAGQIGSNKGPFLYDFNSGAVLPTDLDALLLCALSGDTGYYDSVKTGGYDSFDCYTKSGQITTLEDIHTGWSGEWIIKNGHYGLHGIDDLQAYTAAGGLGNGGTGFLSYFVAHDGYSKIGFDDFEDYTSGTIDASTNKTAAGEDMDGGSNFIGNWIVTEGGNL